MWNCWTGALARLGVAPCERFAVEDFRRARTPHAARVTAAYKDFLALWKDADPDVPVLKEAKAEYANYSGSKVMVG